MWGKRALASVTQILWWWQLVHLLLCLPWFKATRRCGIGIALAAFHKLGKQKTGVSAVGLVRRPLSLLLHEFRGVLCGMLRLREIAWELRRLRMLNVSKRLKALLRVRCRRDSLNGVGLLRIVHSFGGVTRSRGSLDCFASGGCVCLVGFGDCRLLMSWGVADVDEGTIRLR